MLSLMFSLKKTVKPVFRKASLNLFLVFTFVSSISYANHDFDRTVTSTTIKDIVGRNIDVSVLSDEYIQELFDIVRNTEGIPYRYPDDGCYARAHKMSILLEQEGIISVKTFLTGDLRLDTPNSPSGFVTWWYHVVPSVMSKNSKKLIVFDPAASDFAMTKKDWVSALTGHKFGSVDQLFETVRFVFAPDDAFANSDLTDYLPMDLLDMQEALDYFMQELEDRDYVTKEPKYLF